ncbi:MAG: hypothetical protein A4S14_11160 [Proteobacteria bacterium SG_bin9]|nr:MAG: hypothetical protein A4S14_11160 [Proteobacteria bacterium SG_bin9]
MRAEPSESNNKDVLHGAGCRIEYFLKFLAREWMSHIVWILARQETMRFGELRRALPGAVSARVLSARLKELEAYELVRRHDTGKKPLHVEYSLTDDGRRLDVFLQRSEFAADHANKTRASTRSADKS